MQANNSTLKKLPTNNQQQQQQTRKSCHEWITSWNFSVSQGELWRHSIEITSFCFNFKLNLRSFPFLTSTTGAAGVHLSLFFFPLPDRFQKPPKDTGQRLRWKMKMKKRKWEINLGRDCVAKEGEVSGVSRVLPASEETLIISCEVRNAWEGLEWIHCSPLVGPGSKQTRWRQVQVIMLPFMVFLSPSVSIHHSLSLRMPPEKNHLLYMESSGDDWWPQTSRTPIVKRSRVRCHILFVPAQRWRVQPSADLCMQIPPRRLYRSLLKKSWNNNNKHSVLGGSAPLPRLCSPAVLWGRQAPF